MGGESCVLSSISQESDCSGNGFWVLLLGCFEIMVAEVLRNGSHILLYGVGARKKCWKVGSEGRSLQSSEEVTSKNFSGREYRKKLQRRLNGGDFKGVGGFIM